MEPDRIAAALAAMHADIVALRVTPTVEAVTVRRLAELYCDAIEFRALAAAGTERARLVHVVRALGDWRADALTLREVDAYRRSRPAVAPATRNREIVRLTAMLRWGAERGYLPRYPLPRVKLEAERNERRTHRAEVDVRRIVQALQQRGQHAVAALVVTAYDGGLRRAEACRLRWAQLDDGVIHLEPGKSRRPRATMLSAWAASLIANLSRRGEFVFVSRRSRPFNARTVLRYYQRACEEAGIEAARGERNWFHDLRSGFADAQAAVGTPVPHLMELAGWKDYRTVRRYLRRPARSIAIDAKARLDSARRPPKKSAEKKLDGIPHPGASVEVRAHETDRRTS